MKSSPIISSICSQTLGKKNTLLSLVAIATPARALWSWMFLWNEAFAVKQHSLSVSKSTGYTYGPEWPAQNNRLKYTRQLLTFKVVRTETSERYLTATRPSPHRKVDRTSQVQLCSHIFIVRDCDHLLTEHTDDVWSLLPTFVLLSVWQTSG